MAIRLLAADFDLTLSRPDRTVSPRTREAIRRVFAAGRLVTLASGRLSDGARIADGLFPGDVPLILSNGAILQSSATGEILSEVTMEPESAAAMMAWCRHRGAAAVVWSRDGLFADRFNQATDLYTEATGCVPAPILSREAVARAGVYKILLLGRAAAVARGRRALGEHPPARVNAFLSSPDCLEIVSPKADKGMGLRAAAERLGIPREEVAAVGDGENDIPMLRWAGLGVAMGNAPDIVKAAADLIAPPCTEDGAAWLMENYLI